MASTDLDLQLRSYRLTTAEIIYRLPDHPSLLQSYIWQELDIAPKFPVLTKFLAYWNDHIEGKLLKVRVASKGIISAGEFSYRDGELLIH